MSATADVLPARAARRHLRELDSLRACAVASVICSHYLRPYDWLEPSLLGEFGAAGVRLFFVLSGFLITGILLDTRAAVRAGATSAGAAIARFYARRCLRIFPLYFTIVGICWLVGVPAVRHAIGAFVTFTYNLHLIRQGWWDDHLSHFWSLSVEQQFYVVWPALILFLPRRALMPLTFVSIAGAEVARWYYLNAESGGLGFYVSTLSAGDALGIGAWLAMALRNDALAGALRRIFSRPAMAMLVGAWASSPWWHAMLVSRLGFATTVLRDGIELATFAGAVFHAAIGISGLPGRIATWRPLTYLGKISYGLYAYHPLMLPVSSALLAFAGVSAAEDTEAGVPPVALALTLGTAAFSWHALEKPINDLKKHTVDSRQSAVGSRQSAVDSHDI